tara:strand:- start:1236 stop:1592 length:357 start_codon:yes stop_codon:yes gene_type:complete
MIDSFILNSDLLADSGLLDDLAKAVLVTKAESFLRAGGILLLSDWYSMCQDTQDSFVVAGNRITREKAVLGGLSSQSKDSALHIMSMNDDGSMMVRNAISSVLDMAEFAIGRGGEVAS